MSTTNPTFNSNLKMQLDFERMANPEDVANEINITSKSWAEKASVKLNLGLGRKTDIKLLTKYFVEYAKICLMELEKVELATLVRALIKVTPFTGHTRDRLVKTFIKYFEGKLFDLFHQQTTFEGETISVSYLLILAPMKFEQPVSSQLFPCVMTPKPWKRFRNEVTGGYSSVQTSFVTRGTPLHGDEIYEYANDVQSNQYKVFGYDQQVRFAEIVKKQRETKTEEQAIEIARNRVRSEAMAIHYMSNIPFHLVAFFDRRGRAYYRSALSFQTDSYLKSRIMPQNQRENEMSDEEKSIAERWLLIHLANEAGQDKIPYDDRVEWASIWMETEDYSDVDNPHMVEQALWQYKNFKADSRSEAFIGLDASNQALQIYGAGLRDYKSALISNLAFESKREDAYGEYAKALNELLQTDLFTRNSNKKGLMTALYGKSNPGEEIREWAKLNHAELHEFCESVQDFDDMAKLARESIAPMAMRAMEIVLKANKGQEMFKATTDDGFNIEIEPYQEFNVVTTIIDKRGMLHRVVSKEKIFLGNEHSRALAPGAVHALDGFVLREINRRGKAKFGKDWWFSAIHDELRVRPEHGDWLTNEYKEVLILIMEEDMLVRIYRQFGVTVNVPKGNLTAEDIRNSVYAIG